MTVASKRNIAHRKRFEITLWGKIKNERGWEIKATRHADGLLASKVIAKRLLAPHATIETRSSPERWPWWAEVHDRRRSTTIKVDPEYLLVPSVGELGVW
jgi:hypothetical protein